MVNLWLPLSGYEERYRISNSGVIESLAFPQRYLLRTGVPAYRIVKPKLIATQLINSGYLIVHLHLDSERSALLVHRLVALAFCPGHAPGMEVNHINGVKTDNRAENLEWVSRTDNHLHAVRLRLNKQAVPVFDLATGDEFSSITQAAKTLRRNHRTIAKTFGRADE